MARWRFESPEWAVTLRLKDCVPVPPEEVPVDLFGCSLCGATLWMAGQMEIEHDCATGEVTPAY